MLSRYDHKQVKVTTVFGKVFTGVGEVYPAGYGLHVFDRAEQSIRVKGCHIFQSDIRKIEILSDPNPPDVSPRQFDTLMGDLLEGPYWIVDILPEQVPKDAPGQYFSVEQYFLLPGRIRPLFRTYAEILLRLNCYFDMYVSFDSCMSWDRNPDPEPFAARTTGLSGNQFLRAVFPSQRAMIDVEPDSTCMTVYGNSPKQKGCLSGSPRQHRMTFDSGDGGRAFCAAAVFPYPGLRRRFRGSDPGKNVGHCREISL